MAARGMRREARQASAKLEQIPRSLPYRTAALLIAYSGTGRERATDGTPAAKRIRSIRMRWCK